MGESSAKQQDDPVHEHEFYYYPEAANESGWKCCFCKLKPGEPEGFSPELDRKLIRAKVMGLLLDLHNHDMVYVSNGTEGEAIESMVAERCRAEGRFDQYSIVQFIFDVMTPSHAKYWKEISDGIVAGKDPRPRCACGKLPCVYTGGIQYCGDCRDKKTEAAPW